MTTDSYPCDMDTTALAWTTVKNGTDVQLHHVMNEMLRYLTPDGIVQVSHCHGKFTQRRRTMLIFGSRSILTTNGLA